MDNEELYSKHQEFLQFINESEKQLKQYRKKTNKYSKNLSNCIVKLTYAYYPETLPKSENKIREEIQFHYLQMIDSLDVPLSGFEVATEHLVDFPITHTNLEKEIEDLNNDILKYNLPKDSGYLEEIEHIKWMVNKEKYRDEILFNSRKLLYDQFPEIKNFSSNSFLELEYSTKRFAGLLVEGINEIVCNNLV